MSTAIADSTDRKDNVISTGDAVELIAPPGFGRDPSNHEPQRKAVSAELEPLDLSGVAVVEILGADTCLGCAGVKDYGRTLCPGCYALLPPLYRACLPDVVRNYLTKVIEAPDKFIAALKAAVERIAVIRGQAK